jgi:hypothetical protein
VERRRGKLAPADFFVQPNDFEDPAVVMSGVFFINLLSGRFEMRSIVGLLTVVVLAPGLIAQETAVYRHPGAGISIEAPAGWTHGTWTYDPGVYEVSAPNGSIRVLLWFTDTEQDARGYLSKMVGMKSVEPEGDPVRLEIDGHEGWIVFATGNEQGDENVRELLAAIQAPDAATVEGNFIVQIWCPAEPGVGRDRELERLLARVRLELPSG